jgi:hypothetical protein
MFLLAAMSLAQEGQIMKQGGSMDILNGILHNTARCWLVMEGGVYGGSSVCSCCAAGIPKGDIRIAALCWMNEVWFLHFSWLWIVSSSTVENCFYRPVLSFHYPFVFWWTCWLFHFCNTTSQTNVFPYFRFLLFYCFPIATMRRLRAKRYYRLFHWRKQSQQCSCKPLFSK